MSKRSKQFVVMLAFLFLLAGLGVAYYGARQQSTPRPRPPEPRLLAHATKIMELKGLSAFQPTKDEEHKAEPLLVHFLWLSNQEVLFHIYFTREGLTGTWGLYRWNVVSHNEMDTERLEQFWPMLPQPSPNGNWLLGVVNRTEKGGLVYAMTADGSRALQWPILWDNGPILWMRDSRHWVQLVSHSGRNTVTHALIADVEKPKVVEKLPLSPSSPLNRAIGELSRVAILSEDRVLASTWRWKQKATASVDILVFGLHDKKGPTRLFTVHLPKDAKTDDLEFSPQGDRIAWLFTFKQVLPGKKSVWISRLDGSGLHEVDSMPLKTGGLPIDIQPETVQWTPDGKRLSFIYRKALWTVPAK